jgi:hypothetical protein
MHGSWWAPTSMLVVLAVGSLVGGLVGIECGSSFGGWRAGACDGIASGAAAAFASTPVLALMRRLGHARAGSVAASSSEAATWCAVGVSLGVGAALAITARAHFAHGVCAESSTALHLLAMVGALVSLVGASVSAIVQRRGRRLCASALEPNGHPIPGSRRMDLGVGDGLWRMPCHESPYRDVGWHETAFAGDPRATLRSLNHDAIDSWSCALGAVVVMALTFAPPPPVPEAPSSTPRWDSAWYAPLPTMSTVPVGPAGISRRPSILSPRDEVVIRREIEPAATLCFEAGRMAGPKLGGHLVVVLHVEPGGHVNRAAAADAWGLSPEVESCILVSARKARFEPRAADDEAFHDVLQVPFVFPELIPL